MDEKFTNNALNKSLNDISLYRGLIQKNSLIISQGEVVEGEKLEMLLSLKQEYASQLWNELSYYWIIFGYTILVVLTFMSLILFIYNYRPSIFEDNKGITFIFLNVGGFFFVNRIGIKANDVITEIRINGWKFLGLLKLSKNIPSPNDP